MVDRAVIRAERLTTWAAAQDGQHVWLGFEDAHGQACRISLPIGLLSALMMTIPRMLRQALDTQFTDGSLRMIYELGDCRIERAAGEDAFILNLSTPDGFEVAFAVASSVADRLAKTLETCTQTLSAPATTLN